MDYFNSETEIENRVKADSASVRKEILNRVKADNASARKEAESRIKADNASARIEADRVKAENAGARKGAVKGALPDSASARTEMLIGAKGVEKLKNARVLMCGVGGVGGYSLEAIARAGIGNIDILDNDVFSASNLNRQILATIYTVGRRKTEVARERVLTINPNCNVTLFDMFYLPENADEIDLSKYNYVLDAIDTVTAKLTLITRAKALNVPIISSMGTGNKLNYNFIVADIKKTTICPLAKVMRKELKKRGVDSLKVVYSVEPPIQPEPEVTELGRHLPGSISYVPAIAGLTLAAEVIKELLKN